MYATRDVISPAASAPDIHLQEDVEPRFLQERAPAGQVSPQVVRKKSQQGDQTIPVDGMIYSTSLTFGKNSSSIECFVFERWIRQIDYTMIWTFFARSEFK